MSEERQPQISAETEPTGDELDLDLDLDPTEPEPQEPELPGVDEGEGEPGGEQPQEPAAPQPRPGRRERQARELREWRERTERLERELQQIRNQPPPPRIDPQEQARLQAQRDAEELQQVAQLPFEQQGRYWYQKAQRETQQQIQSTQLTVAQAIDKQTWDAACRVDPTRAAFAGRVDDLYNSELRAGRTQNREILYYYLLGQEADRQRNQRSAKQRQQAGRRVQSQTTRPTGARSDGARPGTRANPDSIEAAYERIKGQPLW